jgi:hypothetical protein
MNQKKRIFFIILIAILIIILSYHSVSHKLTKDDYEYIPKYLLNIAELSKESSYQEELDFISAVQISSFSIVPNAGSIPKNQKREPKELYLTKVAGCSARSRTLEKIFRYSGFKTRHVSLYEKEDNNSSIKALLTRNNGSHALSEVLTKKGWLVVDSNYPWISIDADNNPISIKEIQQSFDKSVSINWKEPPQENEVYTKPFAAVYGLYSRHGRFYPPYNFIPDINYRELFQNLF